MVATKKVRDMLQLILTEIIPPKDDVVLKGVKQFLKEAAYEAKRLKIKAQPVLGGSFAKETWLKGDYDVDVFFSFDLKYKNDDISALLEKILAKWRPFRIHGSRDYFQIKNGVCLEIIPVLNIKKPKDAQNVTDFSLWHVAWANKRGKKVKNDIRLTKKFCKAQHVYGAESYIRGFSGHVLDILVIYYKGFLPLMKAAAKWKPKVVIDPENHYKGKALQFMNTAKTESPLVVVDPVQPGRNASAAMSEEKFDAFVSASQAFLKKPSADFFVLKPVDEVALAKKGVLIKIMMRPVDGIENVIGVKLLKVYEFLRKALTEFNLVTNTWSWDKKNVATAWFVVKKKDLPKEIVVEGPPLKLKDHAVRFKQVHKNTFIKKNKIFAYVNREYTTPKDAIVHAITSDYVKDKVKTVQVL